MEPGMIFELALKFKNGLFVSRSRLFRSGGVKVPMHERQIEVYVPQRDVPPSRVKRDNAKETDPQLVYRVTGKKQNHVDHIRNPVAADKVQAMRNALGLKKITREFIPHVDRRGITSRAEAMAYDHASIPTEKLRENYGKLGYKPDRKEMIRMIASATTDEGRQNMVDALKLGTPLIRKPKKSQ